MRSAIVVFLEHSLQQAERLKAEFTLQCECTAQWTHAVASAGELAECIRSCLADPQVAILTASGAHAIAAVSRLEEGLLWSIQSARSRVQGLHYSRLHDLCRHSAHFHINAALAIWRNDSEILGIWNAAAKMLEDAVARRYSYTNASQLSVQLTFPKKSEQLASLEMSNGANGAGVNSSILLLRKQEERQLRLAWAYDVLNTAVQITIDPLTPHIVAYRAILHSKQNAAHGVSVAYHMAADYEGKALSSTQAGISAIWRTASEFMTSATTAELPAGISLSASRERAKPCDSHYYYAEAVAELAKVLDQTTVKLQQLCQPRSDTASSTPQPRLRGNRDAWLQHLDTLVQHVGRSPLVASPSGDMSTEHQRLLKLVEGFRSALQALDITLTLAELTKAAATKPGRGSAIAVVLLRAAAEYLAPLVAWDPLAVPPLDASLRRYRSTELASLACGVCHGADEYFNHATQALALSHRDAAQAWTEAGEIMLAAVEVIREKIEITDIPVLGNVIAGQEHERAAARCADLARALQSATPSEEELILLRTSCTTWRMFMQHTMGLDERNDVIMPIRAQFHAALDDPLSLYSSGDSSDALDLVASLVGERVPPPAPFARAALQEEKQRLVESILEFSAVLDDLTTSDVVLDVPLKRLLSDCTSLMTTITQAVRSESVQLAAARGKLLTTYLLSIRAILRRSHLQEEVCKVSAEVRRMVVDMFVGNRVNIPAHVKLRVDIADSLLEKAREQVINVGDISPSAVDDVALSTPLLPELEAVAANDPQHSHAVADAIVRAYWASAVSVAAGAHQDPSVDGADEKLLKQRKHVQKAREKLAQLRRQLGDALCMLADLAAGTALSDEVIALQVAGREYEIRTLRESERLYVRIVSALQRGENAAATYWKQAAIIRELPAIRAPRTPTSSPLRSIPAACLTEVVITAAAAHYEAAALALEAGETERAKVLLFAAKQTIENVTFLSVGQPISNANEARVKANLRILDCLPALADAVGAGETGAEECFQTVRLHFVRLHEGMAIWSPSLAEKYETLRALLQSYVRE